MSRIDKPTVIIIMLAAVMIIIGIIIRPDSDTRPDEEALSVMQEKVDRAYKKYIGKTEYIESEDTDRKEIALDEVETDILQEAYENYVEPDVIYDIGLSEAFQIWLIDYCYDRDISPYLVMAIIEHESGCNAGAAGDAGESIGLMQIQPRWNSERMDRLGVTDLTDPYQNVMVGVDILMELFGANPDVSWVLMSYNGWTGYADRMKAAGQTSTYARVIMDRAYQLEGEVN